MKVNTYSVVVVVLLSAFCGLGLCREDPFMRMNGPGRIHDCKGFQNSAEIVSIGQFAIEEHNKNENTFLEFAKVVKAKEQVVAGKMYHLTLEAIDAGKKQMYEAKVWVKPWINFKQLQEFKPTQYASSSLTSAGLGGQ